MKQNIVKIKIMETLVILFIILFAIINMDSGTGFHNSSKISVEYKKKIFIKKTNLKKSKLAAKKAKISIVKPSKKQISKNTASQNTKIPKKVAKKIISTPKTGKKFHPPEDYDEYGNLRAPTMEEFLNGE